MNTALTRTELDQFPLLHRGQVRDTYDLGDQLLMVATDRISAFDVIMPAGIPGKGRILTGLSAFWFEKTRDIAPNHFLSTDLSQLQPLSDDEREQLTGRALIVRKANRIDIECVVRGYIAGSAWQENLSSGTIAGLPAQGGLRESDRLPAPVFTPASKSDQGHDENITIDQLRAEVGVDLAADLERISLALYNAASAHALARGIIIADTKFEFGFVDGELIVIDEMLTPDSSRFWDLESYEPGRAQDSFDKQYLRDWLLSTGWDREPPAPQLPADVIEGTLRRYREAVDRLTGPARGEPVTDADIPQSHLERSGVA